MDQIDSTTTLHDEGSYAVVTARDARANVREIYTVLSLADDTGEHIEGDAVRGLVRRAALALSALDGLLVEIGDDAEGDR